MNPTTPPPVGKPDRTVAVARVETVEKGLYDRKDALMAVLPANLPFDRFARVTLQAIGRNERLMQCSAESLLRSVIEAAALGIEPTGLLGSGYLVPYRNKQGVYEAQLIIGYRGLIDLARRSGSIVSIEARTVHERDKFVVEFGTQPHLTHVPYLGPEDPGKYVGVYCYARLVGGGENVEFMRTAEVEAVRRRSKAADDGPWVTDWAEMAKKTVTKRLLKYVPLSVEAREVLEREDIIEGEAVRVPPQVTVPALVTTTSSQPDLVVDVTYAPEPEPEPERRVRRPRQNRASGPETAPEASEAPEVAPEPSGPVSGAPEPVRVSPLRADAEPERCPADSSLWGEPVDHCNLLPGHDGPHRGALAVWPNTVV